MTSNRFIGRELRPERNRAVAILIEERFLVDRSGLHVIFESSTIRWPGREPIEPFTVARHDYEQQGPEVNTPDQVIAHLQESEWARLIWIPYEVGHGCRDRFTIRYAHELQHYRQLLRNDLLSLSNARRFLSERRRSGIVPTIRSEISPNEFDSDVASFDAFEEILGMDSLRQFIERESVDPTMKNFFGKLLPLRRQFKEWRNDWESK